MHAYGYVGGWMVLYLISHRTSPLLVLALAGRPCPVPWQAGLRCRTAGDAERVSASLSALASGRQCILDGVVLPLRILALCVLVCLWLGRRLFGRRLFGRWLRCRLVTTSASALQCFGHVSSFTPLLIPLYLHIISRYIGSRVPSYATHASCVMCS